MTVLKTVSLSLFKTHLTAEQPSEKGVQAEVSEDGRLTLDVSEAMKIWRGLERNLATQNAQDLPKEKKTKKK